MCFRIKSTTFINDKKCLDICHVKSQSEMTTFNFKNSYVFKEITVLKLCKNVYFTEPVISLPC